MAFGGLVIVVAGATGVMGNLGAAEMAVGIIYGVLALIYITPAIFLWKYASRISAFAGDRSSVALAYALEAQKSFWKFVGIFMAILLVIYVVAIAIGILVAVGAAMQR